MIRIVIADDHPVVREGLKRIVAECPDMLVVGEAVDGDGVLGVLAGAAVDVLLLDVSMPGPGFLETMRRLRSELPDLHILVLSVHSEDQYAVRALRSGADGYLTKDHSPDELAAAVRRVYQGGKYVSESLAERLAMDLQADRVTQPHRHLSEREYLQNPSLLQDGSAKQRGVDQICGGKRPSGVVSTQFPASPEPQFIKSYL